MARGIVIGGRRIRFRFFIFLALALALTIHIARLSSKPPIFETIQYGEITSWHQCPALVIRQEKGYTAPDYGKVDFFVSKGQMVEKDTLLAMLYKDSYNQELVDRLYKTKHKIAEYQNKNIVQEIKDGDFEKIQEDIYETVNTMQYSIQDGFFRDMDRHEKQLRGLLSRRKEMLDKGDSTDNYLEQLYEEERDIETNLEEWKVEIISPESGLISFDLDGLEGILSPKDIDYITPEQYLSFNEHDASDYKETMSPMDAPLYKIVDSDRWYIASLIPNQDVYYEQGNPVKINIMGLSHGAIDGRVYRADFLKDDTFLILEMAEGVDQVLEIRNTPVEIGTITQGLMVPRTAIRDKKGKKGVEVEQNGEIQYVEVKIKAMDEEWAIIEAERDTDILEPNTRVIVKVSSKK